jgi:transcriptional regulator with XRE-family HTH domain
MGHYLDMDLLATMVRTQRGNRGLRETATEIGNVSPSTLSRVENGKMPDMEPFLLLCDWLKVPPAHFFKNTNKMLSADVDTSSDTSEAIAIQLRADKHLDPTTANVLATLVKAAYRDLPHRSEGSKKKRKPGRNHGPQPTTIARV